MRKMTQPYWIFFLTEFSDKFNCSFIKDVFYSCEGNFTKTYNYLSSTAADVEVDWRLEGGAIDNNVFDDDVMGADAQNETDSLTPRNTLADKITQYWATTPEKATAPNINRSSPLRKAERWSIDNDQSFSQEGIGHSNSFTDLNLSKVLLLIEKAHQWYLEIKNRADSLDIVQEVRRKKKLRDVTFGQYGLSTSTERLPHNYKKNSVASCPRLCEVLYRQQLGFNTTAADDIEIRTWRQFMQASVNVQQNIIDLHGQTCLSTCYLICRQLGRDKKHKDWYLIIGHSCVQRGTPLQLQILCLATVINANVDICDSVHLRVSLER